MPSLCQVRFGVGTGSSVIDVTVRKSPYIIKFFGGLANQRDGVADRKSDASIPVVLGADRQSPFFF